MQDERPIRRLGVRLILPNIPNTGSLYKSQRRELGRHAFEKHMPKRVHAIAADPNSKNRLAGVIPVLARLLERRKDIDKAYLCQDHVEHIYKVEGEGHHFCGYRNIQMILSAHDYSLDLSVIELQKSIESAWKTGINANALIETGGIVDTRKHIGTAEVRRA